MDLKELKILLAKKMLLIKLREKFLELKKLYYKNIKRKRKGIYTTIMGLF